MRWAISPVIGTGTIDDPYRAKIADYGGHTAIIPGSGDGSPLFGWALGRIRNAAAAAADTDPQITVFPALALDDVLTLAQRDWLIARLVNHGLPSGWVQAGITVREALRTIGRWLDATFDIHWLPDVE